MQNDKIGQYSLPLLCSNKSTRNANVHSSMNKINILPPTAAAAEERGCHLNQIVTIAFNVGFLSEVPNFEAN